MDAEVVPSLPPKHETSVTEAIFAVGAPIFETGTSMVVEHPFPSVTVTEYAPAKIPEIEKEVESPGVQWKEYGAVPPFTVEEADPFE